MNITQYTDKELIEFERLTDSLINWMFHTPNDRTPIIETIREAYDLGKTSHKQRGAK